LGLFEVRPGITGLAQVGGVDMANPNRLAEIDTQYVRGESLARVTVNDTVKIVHEIESIYTRSAPCTGWEVGARSSWG
jgi:lipopolysaccharide/colanic/teichoic acid biosynthesis glycosyltransferase